MPPAVKRPPAKRPRIPPGLPTRAAATRLLSAVLDKRVALDTAIEADAGFNALQQRDRALARAIVGTALRRHGTISAVLDALITKRPPKSRNLYRIMETAAAQLLFMDVPDHAAVSVAIDAVDADRDAQHFKGLANAVLRRMAREREALLAAVPQDADTPPWLMRRWQKTYGEETARAIAEAHHHEPYLDLSVKSDAAGWAQKLGGIALPTGSVRIEETGAVTDMPGFAEGEWWVQDAAAALPAMLLGDVAGKRVADLCSAPGGKTAALVRAGAIVTSVDASPARMARVRENLARLGYAADMVVADVLAWKPDAPFDAILLDAPCTATGTIRRHPDVAHLKQPEDVGALSGLQSRMLAAAAKMLTPGGTLVFCTCSLERDEGDVHIAEAAKLGLTLLPIDPGEIGGLAEAVTPEGTLRTLPSQLRGETPRLSGLDGFFAMRLRKG